MRRCRAGAVTGRRHLLPDEVANIEPVTWYRVKKSMTLRRWTSGSMVRTFLSIISAISLRYIENSEQQVILFQDLPESANVPMSPCPWP